MHDSRSLGSGKPRKMRGSRCLGRKRGHGAKQRSREEYLEKRQRRQEGVWRDGWVGGGEENDDEWDWSRHDDDTWGEWRDDDTWGGWECLGCDNEHLFVRFSM